MASDKDMITRISIEPENQSLLDHHTENHFTAGEVVRDIIIGVSDGLTVPFALAAGLSGANASSSIVLTAGLAEVAAGAISMGLGGLVNFDLITFIFIRLKSTIMHYLRNYETMGTILGLLISHTLLRKRILHQHAMLFESLLLII